MSLTPRLRAVILRQRSYSNAALGEVIASARDADEAVIEAVAGENQDEEDRAPYCTPTYAAMEAGASWVLLGHPKTALPILEKSRSEWRIIRRSVTTHCACHAWLWLMPLVGTWSGRVRLLMRSWRLPRGLARAG